MSKYNFYDYHLTKNDLPEDINAPVEKVVSDMFKVASFDEQVKEWRKKHRFGDLTISTSDGLLGSIINFQNGIVIRYWLIKRAKEQNAVIEGKWSVKNDNIYHNKTNKMEKEST